MHIVAMNGSPHRSGNTATLMRWVVEGCQAAGASVEWLNIGDWRIEYCQGCFGCLRTGTCIIEDDTAVIREHLLRADGIVVGSPVYEGQPTAQLKALLDRLTLLNLYARTFERQWTIGVATSGVAPIGGVAKSLADFFGRRAGVIGAKTTTIAKGSRPLSEDHDPRLPERARQLGRRLVARISRPQRHLPSPMGLWISILGPARPLVGNHQTRHLPLRLRRPAPSGLPGKIRA